MKNSYHIWARAPQGWITVFYSFGRIGWTESGRAAWTRARRKVANSDVDIEGEDRQGVAAGHRNARSLAAGALPGEGRGLRHPAGLAFDPDRFLHDFEQC